MKHDKLPIQNNDVLKILRESIISNKLHPGSHLVERDVANMYCVSRTPVRAAFQQLENEGLVISIPNKGVFVTSLSIEEVCEVYETRSVMEAYASRIALPRLTEEQIERQRFLIHEAAKSVERQDYPGAHALDQEFHYIFFESCGNRRIYNLINELWVFVQRLRRVAFMVPGRSPQTVKEHLEIMKAIDEKDADRLEDLIRFHVLIARDTLVENVKNGLLDL